MRKLIYNAQISLDGVVQGPGGEDEDTSGGFKLGGWAMKYQDETTGKVAREGMGKAGALVLGRRTYDIFAGYWPHQGDENPFAGFLNSVQKYVASRTLEEPLEWQNSRLLQGDVVEAIGELKQQDGGDLVMLGSADLAQTLMEADVIDEYQLWLDPVVLGEGKRLFREGSRMRELKLIKTETSNTGIAMLTYEPIR